MLKSGEMGKMAIWLTGPRWDHVSQPDGGNHSLCLAIILLSGKKAFTFIALLGLLQVATAAVAQVLFRATKCHRDRRPSISDGYLTDPLYLSAAKRFARNYHPIRDIQVLINSLLSRRLGLKWETAEDERTLENHFSSKLQQMRLLFQPF